MSKHHVYLFKTQCLARMRDGAEVPVYKVGYSSNVGNRETQFSIPGKLQLIDVLDFDSEDVARMVERFLLEMIVPFRRIRGKRNKRTEYLYLNDDQFEHLYANFSQFKEAETLESFRKDMDIIRREMDAFSGSFQGSIMGMNIKEMDMATAPQAYVYVVDN